MFQMGNDCLTRPKYNLRQWGLLSVNQTIAYKVLVLGIKILKEGKPEGLKESLTIEGRDGKRRSERLANLMKKPKEGYYHLPEHDLEQQILAAVPLTTERLEGIEPEEKERQEQTVRLDWEDCGNFYLLI